MALPCPAQGATIKTPPRTTTTPIGKRRPIGDAGSQRVGQLILGHIACTIEQRQITHRDTTRPDPSGGGLLQTSQRNAGRGKDLGHDALAVVLGNR